MNSFKSELNYALTVARTFGAQLTRPISDPSRLQRFQAQGPNDTFYIVGPGGTLNDLTPEQLADIEAGTSISINLAALAPIDFDLCAKEAILARGDLDSIQTALRAKSNPMIWFQNRKKHDTPWIKELEDEFDFYRYRRISVSVKGDLASFETAWSRLIGPHVFDTPNLATCFAFTGSIARVVLLGLMLGYRRLGFVGVDLGSTEYFWFEDNPLKGYKLPNQISVGYQRMSVGALAQGGRKAMPNVFEFLTILRRSHPDVDLFTLDRKGRSRVTEFLEQF